ncbi:hypothetical protein, partial [Flavobacterium sp.]|uniref:hypothetical protein n=1 Tax=Flavobacterium sp. TaxID=239 RepID=UPI002614390D
PKKPVAAVQTKRRLNGIDVESVTGQRPNFNYKTLHRIAQKKRLPTFQRQPKHKTKQNFKRTFFFRQFFPMPCGVKFRITFP